MRVALLFEFFDHLDLCFPGFVIPGRLNKDHEELEIRVKRLDLINEGGVENAIPIPLHQFS
jgi:hypothetical protein